MTIADCALRVSMIAQTIRERPLDYCLNYGGDADAMTNIKDMTCSNVVRLWTVNTRVCDPQYGCEYFIAELSDGTFECDWSQGAPDHATLYAAIEYVHAAFCN